MEWEERRDGLWGLEDFGDGERGEVGVAGFSCFVGCGLFFCVWVGVGVEEGDWGFLLFRC